MIPGVSDRKIRVTVTLEPHLAAYAERLVEAGETPSVSAVVNDALEARTAARPEGAQAVAGSGRAR